MRHEQDTDQPEYTATDEVAKRSVPIPNSERGAVPDVVEVETERNKALESLIQTLFGYDTQRAIVESTLRLVVFNLLYLACLNAR